MKKVEHLEHLEQRIGKLEEERIWLNAELNRIRVEVQGLGYILSNTFASSNLPYVPKEQSRVVIQYAEKFLDQAIANLNQQGVHVGLDIVDGLCGMEGMVGMVGSFPRKKEDVKN